MSNLVIVESPSKAKTIEKYLGKGYKVVATVGHVIDLPKSKLGVDLENDYAPQFTTIKGKGAVIKRIKKAIPKGGKVLLAMDPDREGEAIAWHVAEALKLKKPQRVVFYEITKNAVNEAIKHPREVDMHLVNAQIARRVLDRLVGYRVSQVLWEKIWYGLSAGRVQSAALRLIVEREREIEAFIPEEFWKVFADVIVTNETTLEMELVRKNTKKYRPSSDEEFTTVKADLKRSMFKVIDIKKKQISKSPFPPFTTSLLQQAANNMLGFTAKRTMSLAQALYQGGYITYMRTDSFNLSNQAIDAIRETIVQKFGEKYLPPTPKYYKNRSKNAQEAHEAIRPTDFSNTADLIRKEMTGSHAKLYELIWKRAISSQMADRKSEQITITTEAIGASKDSYEFRAGAEKVLFEGFRKIWGSTNGKDDLGIQELSATLQIGEEFKAKKIRGTQHFTQPKPRYTDASLVKALEKHGIGRPSTYATIISTVQDRGYVEKIEKYLHPLEVGTVVNHFLEDNFGRLVDYEYTAGVEDQLDLIAEGKEEYVKFIDQEFKPLEKEIKKAKKDVKKEDVVILEESDEKCPECGGKMVVRLGRYGKFLSCSTFPKCKGMTSLDGGEEGLDFEKYLRPEECPKCKKALVLKGGRYGQFWACSDYPECKGTLPLLLTEKCPECSRPLVERKSRWGRIFIGCSGYPDCKYIKKTPKKKKEEE